MKKSVALLLAISLMLSACGESRIERTGSGAAIGAGIGIAGGFVCCQNPGKGTINGMLLGAAIGAIIGLVVDEPLFFNYHHD